MYSICDFKDIGKRRLLRNGARYVEFWKSTDGNIFNVSNTIKLKDCVEFASCKIIKKNDNTNLYQLIDLANVTPNYGSLRDLENNVVSELGSDKVLLSDSDIVFSKLNSHIGYVFLTNEIVSGYDIVGSTEFFPLKVINNVINPKILKYILLHVKFRDKAAFLRTGKSQSHPRIQRDDFFNIKIPKISNEKELLNKIERYESVINSISLEVKTIQNIIESVLVDFKIINKNEDSSGNLSFVSNLKSVAKQKYLRLGSRYNDFWFNHNGNLFASSKQLKPIKEFVKIDRSPNLKKGVLDKPYILIDFDQVESPLGIINSFENFVSEIGSDKIVFGNCDLLTNKLRPYLGYTILNNNELDLIGTTEFIPLNVFEKKKLSPEYFRYILLSIQYLNKSQFISSGKEHPRISTIDLLNIQIPVPSISIQNQIVAAIHKQEIDNNRYILKLNKIRKMLDDMLETYF
jgi:restriction endonuclease S subunit